jgi:hypothetical protein
MAIRHDLTGFLVLIIKGRSESQQKKTAFL